MPLSPKHTGRPRALTSVRKGPPPTTASMQQQKASKRPSRDDPSLMPSQGDAVLVAYVVLLGLSFGVLAGGDHGRVRLPAGGEETGGKGDQINEGKPPRRTIRRGDSYAQEYKEKEGIFRKPLSELMKTEVKQRHDIIQRPTPEGKSGSHKGVVPCTGDT